jgi:eukaryotic-like serine/threonine-protein kinase
MSNTVYIGPSADRNLLFGILALHAELIDVARFSEAYSAWNACKDTSLADFLVERGWVSTEERAHVEFLVDRKVKRRKPDADSERSEDSMNSALQSFVSADNSRLSQALTALLPAPAAGEKATVEYTPPGRERYTLSRLHAKGGLGQVWVARDGDLGREVALKELRGNGAEDPALLGRFLEEAKITGQLEHPNIVPVYELVRPTHAGSEPFYTMRFIRGRTLAGAIEQYHARRKARQTQPLELRELLNSLIAVCNAVAYAHSRGVIHRDLKPDNVILGDYGEVVLVDWGLAKAKGTVESESSRVTLSLGRETCRGATVQGQAMGTPSYMPPEQAEGRLELVDERSDIYGLGAVLYDILVGEPPFDGSDARTILSRVITDPPRLPRRKVPETPPALEAVCLKALAKNPADRYPTVKEFALELERWLGDEPVMAYREPITTRTRRWLRRHRLLVTAATALLVAAVPLSLIIAMNREQARRQAEMAEQETLAQKWIADVNEQTANRREAETRAVLGFVEKKVFAAARPRGREGGLGPDVTLLQAVEGALPSVRETFGRQPLTEARVHMTLGQSFWYSGKWRVAAEQFQIAHSIFEEQLGPDDMLTLWSATNLANSYADSGRYADAVKLEQETLLLKRAKFGPDHSSTLLTMNNLARSLNSLGRYDDAGKLGEETLALYKSTLGVDHIDTLRCMYNLANSYHGQGRKSEALDLREQTLERRKGTLGLDHPDTLASMISLAISYDALDRHGDALNLFEETLTLQKAALGPDHPETVRNLNNLAVTYARVGRLADAARLLEENVTNLNRSLGPRHPDTLNGMYNVACIHAMMAAIATNPKKEADLAMEWLTNAVVAGYKNVPQIKADTDLNAVRNREDFKKLLADLEAKVTSEKK